jgi:hypothetical protein
LRAFPALAPAREQPSEMMTRRRAGSCCCTPPGRSPASRQSPDWQPSARHLNQPCSPPNKSALASDRQRSAKNLTSQQRPAKYAEAPIWFPKASYMSLTNALTSVCLTGQPQGHIPRSHSWHSKHAIAKMTEQAAQGGVEYTRIPKPLSTADRSAQPVLQRNRHG